MEETHITLTIHEAGTGPGGTFRFHVLVDGELVAGNLSLSSAEAKMVRQFVGQYNALFERGGRPRVAAENLRELGAKLFSIWLGRVWDKVQAQVPSGTRRWLVVASDAPDVLNLPWELLRLPDGDFLGFDARFSVRRLPWTDRPLAPAAGALPPRPLRILFMACAPQDQPLLDYEREEEFLLRAIAGAGPNVAFDSGDLGTFEELRQRVNEFQPHVVHLTGHGVVARRCPDCGRLNLAGEAACRAQSCAASLAGVPALGHFAFEDEQGQADMRSSVEMRQNIFAGGGVGCVFVSGCQTGKAPPVAALGGICQGLVGHEVPLAVGWAASVADDTATRLARTFYDTLAAGQPVDRALTQARQAIRRVCEERGDPSWTLPVLYAATAQGLVFDPDPQRPPKPPPRLTVAQQPLPGMIEGYAEHFVGRRREQQRLLPPLRQGRLQAVLITGLGGAGKSTLATRLARRLEADGFVPIPVPSSQDTPLSAARLLGICGGAFLDANMRDAYHTLRDPDLPVDDRLRYLVTALNRGHFVLVLDNFEVNLDEASRRVLDRELAGFYAYLLSHLTGGSRALITSRYPPADVPGLPPTVREEPLGDFPEGTFLKFLLRDETVEGRYRTGDLSHDLLRQLHRLLGGTPRFLAQIRQALHTMSAADLGRELAAVRLPAGEDPGVLQAARDAYCQDIFTTRLYGYLEADSQRALSRAAVYGVPVSLEGLAAVTGEPVGRLGDLTRGWTAHAMAYPEPGRAAAELWTTYGLLQGWLLAQLDPDERREAHRAAGGFLRDLESQDREGELGLSWTDYLLEARAQYLSAGDCEQAREVTGRISGHLVRQGLYDELARLNEELLNCEEHPGPMSWIGRAHLDQGRYPGAREWYQRSLRTAGDAMPEEAAAAWHGLATIDLREGEYGAAREKFQKSLEIKQQIGDRAGEAGAWHQLATIDLDQGEYGAAREKFQQALTMRQQIGDRAGEAAAFYQLGFMAAEQGHLVEGARLVALCFLIDQSIGHGDTESDFQALAKMAAQLNYTQKQLQAMMQEVVEAYQRDRGRGLVEAMGG